MMGYILKMSDVSRRMIINNGLPVIKGFNLSLLLLPLHPNYL